MVLNLVLGKEREKEKEEGGRESGSRVQEELALGSAGFQLLSSTRDQIHHRQEPPDAEMF